jgi:hypothetical protein
MERTLLRLNQFPCAWLTFQPLADFLALLGSPALSLGLRQVQIDYVANALKSQASVSFCGARLFDLMLQLPWACPLECTHSSLH